MKKSVLLMGSVLLALMLMTMQLLWHELHRAEEPAPGGSGAAQGLMLLEMEKGAGLYVLAVIQESPADKAGIQPGDYLLSAQEAPLETAAQLDAMIDAAPEELSLTVQRGTHQLQIDLPTR